MAFKPITPNSPALEGSMCLATSDDIQRMLKAGMSFRQIVEFFLNRTPVTAKH